MLSKRLETIASMVPRSKCVADVGCDHGFLSIELVKRGVVDHALALDINKGPLEKAAANIAAEGLSEQIETILSDGLNVVKTTKLDGFIIAGMGGRLGLKIIYDRADMMPDISWAVISLQSELDLVRYVLKKWGVSILRDVTIYDENKYYNILTINVVLATFEETDKLGFEDFLTKCVTEFEALSIEEKSLYRYGDNALDDVGSAKEEYIQSELNRYEKICDMLKKQGIEDARYDKAYEDVLICKNALKKLNKQ